MIRLKNPAYVPPIMATVNLRKAAVNTYLTNNAAFAEITFDKIRADNPALAADLTDGVIAEICKALGIDVLQ